MTLGQSEAAEQNTIMRFTALTIREGDAFLLEDNYWPRRCLFDSGKDGTIVDLLKYKGVNCLDLAICSHNDADHAKGFIELLKSDIRIQEIWLPGLWSSILLFIKDFYSNNNSIEHRYPDHPDYNYNEDLKSLFSDDSVSVEGFNDELSFFWEWEDFEFDDRFPRILALCTRRITRRIASELKHYSLMEEGASSADVKRLLDNAFSFKMENIIEIAMLAHQHKCRIRWFEPTDDRGNIIEIYGFVPLNSQELCRVWRFRNSLAFMHALTLSKENKNSLAFEYVKDNVPVIRFSADSRCIAQSVRPYTGNIIVTAPHHGSRANDEVYDNIQGDNIIWVRSDSPSRQGKRPSDKFKSLKDKYCLACKKYNFISEICFEYEPWPKLWHYVRGERCRCKI